MLINGWDVRIDPWAVEYGSETPGASVAIEEVADDEVDVSVEVSQWSEFRPPSAQPACPLVFVDGVRRIESRLVVTRDSRLVHGAVGSYGVGAVRVDEGRALFAEYQIGRTFIFGGGETPGGPLELAPGLKYEPVSVADDDPDAPIRGLHTAMRQCEERFANALAVNGTLVVADGPLNISQSGGGRVVGFVKRLFRLYVPPEQLMVVRSLSPGARSPVFLIRSAGRFSRYSWFVRLGSPLRMESEFTGIVRLEVAESVGVSNAVNLANAITAWLPRFVPSRTRDPRAPQNLIPIGALEQHLRHQMGDSRLIKRWLATLLASGSLHV
jgi:hypothetical protein